ncbi:MAG: nucleotidyl transferase AbiEii/AbiGii toxin family protein [Gemmatimonadetes bacterium]|nr:nucleotidyl transferase AbiEii/AbiGii toxin family protein [Gemmatimonadota bacterium]
MRNWVSHIVLGGALETAGFEGAGRKFTIKGGVALELRLRHLARATKDLDLILNSDNGDLIEELEGALSRPYQGFSFRRKDQPELMPNGAARVEISLQYLGKPWGTVQVDIARYEGNGAEVEMVEAISLAPFGISGPEALPCLSLPFHIAQKIHGMTLPPPEGRRNERFRDLVDLLLLREWVTDFDAVQHACREVFANRGTHAWPPFFEVPEHWIAPFERMASDLNLNINDICQAAIEVRQFISEIDASATWLANVPLEEGLSATTWYFALGSGDTIHRIPAHVGEAFWMGRGPEEVPSEWQHEPGEILLIGVVLFLRDRQPIFIESASVHGVALVEEQVGKPVECGPEVWDALALEILRQARAPIRGVQALRVFLTKVRRNLPCVVAAMGGVSAREAHRWRLSSHNEQLLWNLRESQPVLRARIDALRTAPPHEGRPIQDVLRGVNISDDERKT